jgi:hypothetical protein
MNKFSSFFKGFNNPWIVRGTLVAIFSVVIFFVGCYEWRNIFQPSEVGTNSFFDVWLSAQDDGNPDNDWENPDNHDIGLFGVMLPEGWTVKDSIHYWVKTTEAGYDNDGILLYNAEHSQTLTDSIPPAPGYYWWGAKSQVEVSLVYFDSLYLEPRIYTDGQVGTFYLRYAIGDEDYWDRNPADDVSDPIEITTVNVAIPEILSSANVRLYPNPASDRLHITFNTYENNVIRYAVVDMTGRSVLQGTFVNRETTLAVDQLASGPYFLRMQNGKEVSIHKFVVR